MYWNYEIKGGDVSTRPVHVMDDGAKTYIQMPVETIHRELPVLVVQGPERIGDGELSRERQHVHCGSSL